VRVVTFNIRHHTDAAGVCLGLGADLIGLQEVDVNARRSGRVDQAETIARACRMRHVFGAAHRLGLRGRYGNALLSRNHINDVDVVSLPRPAGKEQRVAILATTGSVSVAVTHLGQDRAESAEQLTVVLTALFARPAPRLLLGDLNRRDYEIDILETEGLDVAGGGATYPAHAPTLRIDHVAVDGLRITDVQVPSTTVSDHLPLVVDVERAGRDGAG
jgi:endonuclease/exonuclease/phosphatase family metal-dependent hydrolase